jgi:hypothetical protein
VRVSDGQTSYPFTFTPPTIVTSDPSIRNSIPLYTPFNASFDSSKYLVNMAMNANGFVAAVEDVSSVGETYQGVAYFVQRNPDGSWGSPSGMWAGPFRDAFGPDNEGPTILGINKMNEAVGIMYDPSYPYSSNAALFNMNTGVLTNLSSLSILSKYVYIYPLAIDDLGRILLEADPVSDGPEQTLLLTPDGVSSDPIILSAPEPGSWAVMALAVAAFAAHRARERRRCS